MLNVFRSCYLNQLFCKFSINFSKYFRPLGSWSAKCWLCDLKILTNCPNNSWCYKVSTNSSRFPHPCKNYILSWQSFIFHESIWYGCSKNRDTNVKITSPSPGLVPQWGRSSWQSPPVYRCQGSESPEIKYSLQSTDVKDMRRQYQLKSGEKTTWKALSSSWSWAEEKVVRILLCFRFSVRTPSCPGYILYGNPAVEVTLYVNCKIYTLNQKKRRNLIDHTLYKSILPIIKSPVS